MKQRSSGTDKVPRERSLKCARTGQGNLGASGKNGSHSRKKSAAVNPKQRHERKVSGTRLGQFPELGKGKWLDQRHAWRIWLKCGKVKKERS